MPPSSSWVVDGGAGGGFCACCFFRRDECGRSCRPLSEAKRRVVVLGVVVGVEVMVAV
jgi:hypothetical protein